MAFPKNFVWGAAAAAYQIEGAAAEDGRGDSVWDMFCRTPGKIWQGHSGDVACDHYHRYEEDVRMMQGLGLQAYRLSVSWPRVLPEGVGRINERGLDFYDRLIDSLLAAKVTPYVTLFHWDFPLSLYHKGGWLNRDSAEWFAEYTGVVARKLGDRVQHWMTLNEPQVYIGAGHHEGRHAPGLQLRWAEILTASHNTLLAHGRAVQALRANSPKPCQIGYAPVGVVNIPATETEVDINAARQRMFAVKAQTVWNNTWWMDPIFHGHYPEDGLKVYAEHMPKFPAEDLKVISSPVDFLGLNIYRGHYTSAGVKQNLVYGAPKVDNEPPGFPITAFDWPVTPEALYWGPKFFTERYKKPVLITENGLSLRDWEALDGKVHDPQRIDFVTRYLRYLHRAISENIDVRGYLHWSIMDNFEWGQGYKERFGMVFVDYQTQRRILKDSALWYAEVIRSNGANLLP